MTLAFVKSSVSCTGTASRRTVGTLVGDRRTEVRGRGLAWVLFAMVLISRIKSWVSTCRENKQISCTPSTQLLHSFDLKTLAISWLYCITPIHTWAAILCSASRMSPSQPRPRGRLTPSPCLNMLPIQFWLLWPTQQHVVCSNSLYFTRSTLLLQLS